MTQPVTWSYQRSSEDACEFEVVNQDGDIVAGEWGIRNEDDARLISTAPELLKALKYARRWLRKEDHDTDYVDQVIAKAESEAA